MSSLFILSGHSSELSSDFTPSIELDPNLEYTIGLISFDTYMTIPNIDSSGDTLYYGNNQKLKIPTGQYEIDDINKFIRGKLGVEYTESEEYYNKIINKGRSTHEDEKSFFNITPNTSTLKCNVISSYPIDFTQENSIGKLLGFKEKILEPNKIHESDETVNIFKVNTIRIDCNIVMGSYNNGKPSHTLYQFFPTVEPGYKIVETPSNIVYLPINTQTINNITVRIVDQNQKLINFREELINIGLHLKPIL